MMGRRESGKGVDYMIRQKGGVLALHRFVMAVTLILLSLSLISISTSAVPAAPVIIYLNQPDGTTFPARPFGDERHNGLKTLDGYPILRDEKSGRWVYAERGPDGTLKKTDLVVGKSEPARPLSAFAFVPIPSTTGEPSPWRPRPARGPRLPVVGVNKVLVILVEFDPDPQVSGELGEQFAVGTTPTDWQAKVFGTSNSVRAYYQEVSYGQLDLVPAEESYGSQDGVVGWLRLPQTHPGTAADPDEASLRLARAAILAADPYVDFAAFDIDGNSYISTQELHVVIVVAGYEQAYGGSGGACSPSLWAHNWSLEGPEVPVADGVRVADYFGGGSYIQLGEWHCSNRDNPGHPATIGVLAHELGHDLGSGAPDLYDIDGSSSGIGDWGLMGSGAWNGLVFPGDSPAHMTAWTKWLMGWIAPTRVTSELLSQGIPQVESNHNAVYQLLDNPGGVDWNWSPGRGEYFLIENRQRVGYDAALPGEGLLIWHIDESQVDNSDEARRLVGLVQADGRGDLDCSNCANANDGDEGDPFPGATENRFFNDGSNPSSRLYGGFPSGVAVERISDSGRTMFADLIVEALPNDPPIAEAGPDQKVNVGETVRLDGTGSFDPNGDQLSFTWTFVSTPPGSRRRVGSRLSGPTPSFIADMPGDYVLELLVEDGRGGSATDQVTITAVAEILFSADFEAGTDGWQATGWGNQWHQASDVTCIAPQPGYSSPTHAWHYGRQDETGRCGYSGSGELISPPIPTNGATKLVISFSYFLQLADRRDRAEVRYSYDGGRHWRSLWSGRRALQGSWTEAQETIRLRRGTTAIKLKFSFTTSRRSSGRAAGWFIDDIQVSVLDASTRGPQYGPSLDSANQVAVQALPNPVTSATVRFTATGSGIGEIAVEVFDLAGRRVFESGWVENGFAWHLLNSRGEALANGVYLYVVTVKGYNGQVLRSEVRKLVVLR
jgi:M6 family metalloprotease-like protein